jgi:hypothetical protein
MPKQEEIAALREEIEKKERQLYRANKEMTVWNKGKYKTHSNAKMSKLFVESLRKEIAGLHGQLWKLEKEA